MSKLSLRSPNNHISHLISHYHSLDDCAQSMLLGWQAVKHHLDMIYDSRNSSSAVRGLNILHPLLSCLFVYCLNQLYVSLSAFTSGCPCSRLSWTVHDLIFLGYLNSHSCQKVCEILCLESGWHRSFDRFVIWSIWHSSLWSAKLRTWIHK